MRRGLRRSRARSVSSAARAAASLRATNATRPSMAPKSAPTPHTLKPVFGRLGLSLPFGFFLNRLPIRPLYPPLPRLRAPPPAPGHLRRRCCRRAREPVAHRREGGS